MPRQYKNRTPPPNHSFPFAPTELPHHHLEVSQALRLFLTGGELVSIEVYWEGEVKVAVDAAILLPPFLSPTASPDLSLTPIISSIQSHRRMTISLS
jgi:hypothetical protein